MRKSSELNRAFEAAKHIYDLVVISHHPQIISLLKNNDLLKLLLDIRTEEEQQRHDGIPGVVPKEFTFFRETECNREVKAAYEIMQKQYVLRVSDRIEFEDAVAKLHELEDELLANMVWEGTQFIMLPKKSKRETIETTDNLKYSNVNNRLLVNTIDYYRDEFIRQRLISTYEMCDVDNCFKVETT